MNKEIEIRTYRAINKSKEFYGLLKAYDKDTVTITETAMRLHSIRVTLRLYVRHWIFN